MTTTGIDYNLIRRRAIQARFVDLVRQIRYLELVEEFNKPRTDPEVDRRLCYCTAQLSHLVEVNRWLIDDEEVPS